MICIDYHAIKNYYKNTYIYLFEIYYFPCTFVEDLIPLNS